MSIELLPERRDVAGATDELRRLTPGQWRGSGLRRLLDVVVQRGIVGEDASLQLPGRRRDAQAHLVPEHRAEVGAAAECLGLPAAAVEGQHQLPPELLAERMVGDERLELGHHPGVVAGFHPGVDELLGHREPQLLQAQGLSSHAGELGELAERATAPETERALERRDPLGTRLRHGRGPRTGPHPAR